MKRILTIVLVVMSLSVAAQAAEQTAWIAVSKLSCPSCVYIVATSMKAVPTVVVVDFQEGEKRWQGVFTVTYDDASATPEMIVKAVMSNGYPAAVVTQDGS